MLRDKSAFLLPVLGPVILMSALSWSISFDVQNLTFAVLDRDQSSESRSLNIFCGSRYFVEQPPPIRPPISTVCSKVRKPSW